MLYIISCYIFSITIVHLVLFVQSGYTNKIVLINSITSCLVVMMLLLSFYFKDTNFIDVIFFYIIMSPIGFYGIFLFYKNSFFKKNAIISINNQENGNIQNKKNIFFTKKNNLEVKDSKKDKGLMIRKDYKFHSHNKKDFFNKKDISKKVNDKTTNIKK